MFSITHPCFYAPMSDWTACPDGTESRQAGHYFAEGFWHPEDSLGIRGKVGAQHRTLATYLNAGASSGFILERIAEPRASGEVNVNNQMATGLQNVPAALVVRCRLTVGGF